MLMSGRKPVSPLRMPYAGFEKATNCILEIPQNIKLTLENNVVTVKAGSILTRTGEIYSTVTTTVDKTYTLPTNKSNGRYYVLCQQGNGTIDSVKKVNEVKSGTTEQRPAFEDVSLGYAYFNTDTKQWNFRSISSWNENWAICYPICIVEKSDYGWSFAKDSNGNDMIFNGAGFIEHHAFIYPNVKALIPNGFNSDGSLKTIEATTNSLSILEMALGTGSYGDGSRYFAISTTGYITGWGGYTIREKDEDFTNDNWLIQYIKESNKTYTWTSSEKQQMYETPFIKYKCDTNGLVTKFDVSQSLTKYRWVVKLVP